VHAGSVADDEVRLAVLVHVCHGDVRRLAQAVIDRRDRTERSVAAAEEDADVVVQRVDGKNVVQAVAVHVAGERSC
jgi:hypothetical protein